MSEILITSAISVIIAVMVTRYFTARMALRWAYSRRKVLDPIGGKYPSGVETFLDGEKVDHLVEWKIAIWNSGNRPIRASDFIEENSITLSFEQSEILKAEAVEASRDIVGGNVSLNLNEITVADVQILDCQDYLVLRCYGRLDDPETELSREHRPKISAHIARIPRGVTYTRAINSGSWFQRLFLVIGALFYLFFGFGLVVGGLTSLTSSQELAQLNDAIDGMEIPYFLAWIAVPGGIFFALAGLAAFLLLFLSFFGNPPKSVRDTLVDSSMMSPLYLRLLRIP